MNTRIALLLLVVPIFAFGQGSNFNGGTVPFAGVPLGACAVNQTAVNTLTNDFYYCKAGVWTAVTTGGGGTGTVTSIATTSPIAGGTITTTGTITCATCTTSAAALTSTAFVAGAGSQAEATPSATSTLDSSGNASFAGTLAATGHTTFEGVTSTGATGTGKLVYDTNPALVPLYYQTKTGISMNNGATGTLTAVTGAECTSGVCTMTTPAADSVYRLDYNIWETTAGSTGTCTVGTVRLDVGYKAMNGVTYGNTVAFAPMTAVGSGSVATGAAMSSAAPAAANDFRSVPITFIAKSGTAMTYTVDQAAQSNCTTAPVFSIWVRLVYLGPA